MIILLIGDSFYFKVYFSNELVFEILDNKCQNIHRGQGEEFLPQCLIKTAKHPVSIMVWSMMSVNGARQLHIVEGKMNQHKYINVLNQILLPDIPNHFPNGGCIFQHDRAPCHTAKLMTAFPKKY